MLTAWLYPGEKKRLLLVLAKLVRYVATWFPGTTPGVLFLTPYKELSERVCVHVCQPSLLRLKQEALFSATTLNRCQGEVHANCSQVLVLC